MRARDVFPIPLPLPLPLCVSAGLSLLFLFGTALLVLELLGDEAALLARELLLDAPLLSLLRALWYASAAGREGTTGEMDEPSFRLVQVFPFPF